MSGTDPMFGFNSTQKRALTLLGVGVASGITQVTNVITATASTIAATNSTADIKTSVDAVVAALIVKVNAQLALMDTAINALITSLG